MDYHNAEGNKRQKSLILEKISFLSSSVGREIFSGGQRQGDSPLLKGSPPKLTWAARS